MNTSVPRYCEECGDQIPATAHVVYLEINGWPGSWCEICGNYIMRENLLPPYAEMSS